MIWVVMSLLGGFLTLCLTFPDAQMVQEVERDAWNDYARDLWLDGKPGFYPHELENGSVRWYRVLHDNAMDDGCGPADS